LTYFCRPAVAVPCKLDSKTDAYWVYYCRVDKKYFRYTMPQVNMDLLTCPNGHEIENEDR
jgi:hypothetical protein